MNIKDFFKPKEKIVYKEKLIQSESEPLWKSLYLGEYNSNKPEDLLSEYTSWTYANIQAIAEAVSQIKFRLYRVVKDDVEEVKEHPVLETIYRPNQFMTKSEFIFLLQVYKLLTGESPIRIKTVINSFDNKNELWAIDPTKFAPKVGRTDDGFQMITGYTVIDDFNGKQTKISLEPQEVIYMKNMNPKNIWRGMGVVEASQNSIDTMHYAEAYNLNFFKNSAIPFTVLYSDKVLNEQIISRLKDTWDRNYRGTGNAYKTAILEAGLKVERLQQSAKDMDFLEQQKFLRDKLMAMFKTTKIALGITEDVNRANAEASEYVFMKNCIKPKMQQLTDSFNEFLLPLFDKTGELFLDFEDPVPENRELTLAENTQAINKWKTINEVREKESLDPVEGGDELLIPFGLSPIGSDPQTPIDENKIMRLKVKKVSNIHKFREQVMALRNRNIRQKQLKEQLLLDIKKFIKSKIKAEVVNRPKYKDIRKKSETEKFIKTLESNSDKFEGKMNRKMSAEYYGAQMNEILRKIGGSKSIKGVNDYMFDKKRSVNTGIKILTPLMEEILINQGKEALLTVSSTVAYSLLDEARKYLKREPVKLSKTITETAYERVRNTLSDGIKNGESISELRDRILKEYESLEKYQAETIARTEVTRATNFATIDAYKQSGVVEGKEWVVANDDRLCEFCMAMESQTNSKIALDDDYFKIGDKLTGVDGGVLTIDYSDIQAPPLHVNCRCVTVAVRRIEKKIEVEEKELDEDMLLKDIDEKLDKIRKEK